MQETKDEFINKLVDVSFDGKLEASYFFTYKRINQKFIQLYNTYRAIETIDYDLMFSMATEIILTIVDRMDKDYIYISNNRKKDDISYIITTLEQRINDSINEVMGSYRDRSDGEDETVSIEKELSLDQVIGYNHVDDEKVTLLDIISEQDLVPASIQTDDEIDEALNRIYEDAKLTGRQIEVLQALDQTEDNYNNRKIYNKAEAAKILGTSESNVRKTFHIIKKKIQSVYGHKYPERNTRQELIDRLNKFLDNIESEKDVVRFINQNINKDFMGYLLYDSNLDLGLVRYFRMNRDRAIDENDSTMRKFCTYFLKEVYDYISMLENSIELNKKAKLHKKDKIVHKNTKLTEKGNGVPVYRSKGKDNIVNF